MYFLAALYFHISVRIFCNLFICFVFYGLFQSIYFRMFCSKHSITFDTYLLNCRFHCVGMFYTNFRSCETFTVKKSRAILSLIEPLSNFRNVKYWFILYLQGYILGQCKFKCIVCPTRLSCNSHSIDICTVAIKNIKNMHAVSTNQIADIFCILTINRIITYTKKYLQSDWLRGVFAPRNIGRICTLFSIFVLFG